MIKQQNYQKITQLTKKALQIMVKRTFAQQIINSLNDNIKKYQQSNIQQTQQIYDGMNNIDSCRHSENNSDQIEQNTKKNHKINKQNIFFSNKNNVIKIVKLNYGDYVTIETKIEKEEHRILSYLNILKVFNSKEIQNSIINSRKAVFEICYPLNNLDLKGQAISKGMMICLKNVFSGHYITLTNDIFPSHKLNYKIILMPTIERFSIFKLTQKTNSYILSDQQLIIESYYSNKKLSINQESFNKKTQRQIIGTYSSFSFKMIKYQLSQNLFIKPYYYIRYRGFDGSLEIQQPNLDKFTVRKSIRAFQVYDAQEKIDVKNKDNLNQQDQIKVDHLYELVSLKQVANTMIKPFQNMNLSQIWQIQRTNLMTNCTFQCKIKSIITNQSIEIKQSNDSLISFKRNNVFRLKQIQGNIYNIHDEDNNKILVAAYDQQSEKYKLKFQYQQNLLAESIISNNSLYKFQILPLENKNCQIILQLLQYNEILKINHSFIVHWGFKYQQRSQTIRYSYNNLKHNEYTMKQKIKEIVLIFDKIVQSITRQDKFRIVIQNIIKQITMLDVLILYCQIFFIKIGKKRQEKSYKLAGEYLKTPLLKLLKLIYCIISNNKLCSLTILQNNYIFNELLSQYIDPVSQIINQAIKNVSTLTLAKTITHEDDIIFSWTKYIQQIKSITYIQLQKVYLDIISEVIIDPNDNGIYIYQIKIKQQLIGHRKKKILPKFKLQISTNQSKNIQTSGINQSKILKAQLNNKFESKNSYKISICFDYPDFPISFSSPSSTFQIKNDQSNKNFHGSSFQLYKLFSNNKNKPQYSSQIEYIGSILKLIRNLCKDRNKKIIKIMQDYGLTLDYMHEIFYQYNLFSWQLLAKFIDIYCSMYLIQEPLLSFHNKQIKCFISYKIKKLDFNLKIFLLFNQYTEQVSATQKCKTFDYHILPLIRKYFQNINRIQESNIDQEQINAFLIFLNVLYEVVSYGYLDYFTIQKYLLIILKNTNLFVSKTKKIQNKEQIITKVINLVEIIEEISRIIQGYSLMKNIYLILLQQKDQSITQLKEIFIKVLDYDSKNIQENNTKSRRNSINLKSSQIIANILPLQNFNEIMVEFVLKTIIDNKINLSSSCLTKAINVIENINKRGVKLCEFIQDILLLNSVQQEALYIQFSGRIPKSAPKMVNSQRKLLNIMKVQEIVSKIIEEKNEIQSQYHKKQKISQLKNLLIKIIKYLEQIYISNNKLYKICQVLFRKLSFHTHLIEIMKQYDFRDEYEPLVEFIIKFFIEFMRDNEQNISIVSKHYAYFIKKFNDRRLPYFISVIFPKIQDNISAFWQIYKQIDKKMQQINREIFFEIIYVILKISSQQILNQLKGQIIYTLISNNFLKKYILSQFNSEAYPNFIKIVCLIGKDSPQLKLKISQLVKKHYLLGMLTNKGQNIVNNYSNKLVNLKLYYYLFIQNEEGQVDQIQLDILIQQVVLYQLKRFPSTCHSRAISEVKKIKDPYNSNSIISSNSKINNKDLSNDELQKITQQYSSLMFQGASFVHISEEQNFFLYFLNLEDESDLTLLSFLQKILLKYNIKNHINLSSYLSKLLNFLQKIFSKGQKNYQSKIFNKLYQIAQILESKYGNIYKSSLSLHYSESYAKAEQFLSKLAQTIQKQKISFKNMINSFNITQEDIELYKKQELSEKLILQQQFIRNLKKLSFFINNKQQYTKLIQNSNIKQFYRIFQQKNKYKINVIKFCGKLLLLLEYNKKKILIQKYNVIKNQYFYENKIQSSLLETQQLQKKQRQHRNNNQKQQQVQLSNINEQSINPSLVYQQFKTIVCVFQDLLHGYLSNKLEKIIDNILQVQVQNNGLRDQNEIKNKNSNQIKNKKIKFKNLIQIHLSSSQFTILHKIIFKILKIPENITLLQNINVIEYLHFILKTLQEYVNQETVQIIQKIYHCIFSNKQQLGTFMNIMESMLEKIFNLIQKNNYNNSTDFSCIYDKFLRFLLEIIEVQSHKHESRSIQEKICQHLIICYRQFNQNGSLYWFKITKILTQNTKNMKQYKIFPISLSCSEQINEIFTSMIVSIINTNLFNTNLKYQLKHQSINLMLSLIKNIKMKGFHLQTYKIIINWPFAQLFQTYLYNYHQFLQSKLQEEKYCQQQNNCSQQYCNNGMLTPYDLQIYDFLSNILIMIKIGSQVQSEDNIKYLINQPKSLQLLTEIYKLKLETRQTNNNKNFQYFHNIRKIMIKLQKQQLNQIYFPIPTNTKYKNQIQNQINFILPHINQQNHYKNLHQLSIYIQQQLQNIKQEKIITLLEYQLKQTPLILYCIIIYMLIISINITIHFLHFNNILLLFINTILMLYNMITFAFSIKRIYRYRKLLITQSRELQYKLIALSILSILRIISYALLNFIDAFYVITLVLQCSKIQIACRIIFCFVRLIKSMFLNIVYINSVGIIFVFMENFSHYSGQYSNRFQYYKQLFKQIILFHYLPITSEAKDYKILSQAVQMQLIIFKIIILIYTAALMSTVIIQLRKIMLKSSGQLSKCQFCRVGKTDYEKKGLRFSYHVKYEHNSWNYIYFFIFMRRNTEKSYEYECIKQSIQNNKFTFLKV